MSAELSLSMSATTTEAPQRRSPLVSPTARKRVRRWWRRRPINRALVLLHRWPALILGLFLVVETTSGAIVLYNAEIFRWTHSELYAHSASGNPITPDQAIDVVAKAHPTFGAAWVAQDHGIYAVGEESYKYQYFVDPQSGRINGKDSLDTGVMGFLTNLHDCALSCESYTGYVAWFATPVWDGGPSFLLGITRGGLILGGLGLLMILLVVSSIKIWWPGRKRLKARATVRRGKGRFARDYDLHNVIGAVSLPFVLIWAVTGAAFEFPVVEKAWLAITGGEQPPKVEDAFFVDVNPAAKKAPDIGAARAVDVALAAKPGSTVTFVGRPTAAFDNYEIDLVTGTGPRSERAIYSGDTYVLVDPRDATNFKVIDDGGDAPAANRFYDRFLEPTHFGWNVNGWWRIVWFVMGMAPLALMVTGISTWLYRRGIKKRRVRAGRKKLTDAQLDPDHLDRDGDLDSAGIDPGDDDGPTVDDEQITADEHGTLQPADKCPESEIGVQPQ